MSGLGKFVLAAIVAMVGAMSVDSADADSAGTALGTNLAGEPCSAAGVSSPDHPLSIVCGKQEVAGTLRTASAKGLSLDASARTAAMTRHGKEVADSAGQMTCDNLWAGSEDILLGCTVVSTGWPHIIVVSVTNGTAYVADGLPSTLPVLEKAIASLSGRAPSVPEAALRARYSSGILKSGASDLASFGHFLQAGRLASGTSNYAAAESDYRAALDIEQRQFGGDSMPVGETLAELALQVSNQVRFDEADALFRRAANIIQGSPDIAARERLTSYLALNAANQRRFQDALVFAREVTAEYRGQINEASAVATNGGPPVPTALRGELAHSLRIEAEMALRMGEVSTARAATDEAVWIVSEVQELPLWWKPEVLALTAEVSEQEGQVVVAERNFRGAISLDKKLFGDTTPTALAEMKLGGFYSRQQVYAPAVANYRDALGILEKNSAAGAVLQPDQVAPLLDAAIADPKLGIDADVFRAVQMMQWSVSDETIARMAARRAAGNGALADLVNQNHAAQNNRDNLRMALASQYAKTPDEQDSRQLETLASALKAASAQSDTLSEKLRKSFPEYARLANPGPAGLNDTMSNLAADEAFVTFLFGKSQGYALSVTRKGLKIRRLAIARDEVAQDVAMLRGEFAPRLGRLPSFSLKASYSLYQRLLKPLEPDLANVRHLVVAPSGELANLPFALLVTAPVSAGEETSYDKAAWLIRRLAISEVPSARAFLLLRQAREQRKKAPRPFMGLGEPVFTQVRSDVYATCAENAGKALQQTLPPLPDTKREVETVATSLGAGSDDVLLGSRANKAELNARPLDQFAVLYFATHGLLPSELRCQNEPGLVLSPAPAGSSAASSSPILYASEISSLRLNADLVILSACNTAAAGGNRYGGGALEGLADSFFDAGARAVLASHWSVPSAETTKMMIKMFDLSAHQVSYAEALRQAQLAMIADRATAHPFNWAAFTLVGDGAGNHS